MNTTPDPRYAAPARPLLLDVVREHIRTRHLSPRTEKSYVHWIRFYVRFHNRRHPRDLGAQEVEAFLSHLAVERHVSSSTQNQALAALLFLYKVVLGIDMPWLDGIVRAKRPQADAACAVRSMRTEKGVLTSANAGIAGLPCKPLPQP